ncbi:hypothetical protein ACYOEI_10915 [Singulisphaera rosea]
MEDIIKQFGWDSVAVHWRHIAGAAGGLVVLGLLLRPIKLLLAKAPDLARRMAGGIKARPRAVLLLAVVACLGPASFAAGYKLMPAKVVEKPVEKVVVREVFRTLTGSDNEQIKTLQSQLKQYEGYIDEARREATVADQERRQAEYQKTGADELRAKAERQVAELNARLEKQVAELNRKSVDLNPSKDRSTMEKLSKAFDDLHASGVGSEVDHMSKTTTGWQSRFVTSPDDDSYYHRQCAACQRNATISKEMAGILRRHPRWTRSYMPDESALLAEENAAKSEVERKELEEKRKEAERYSRLLTAFGETKSIAEWAKDDIRGEGVDANAIAGRIKDGWEPRKAIELDTDFSTYVAGSGMIRIRGKEAESYGESVRERLEAKKKADLAARRKAADEEEARAKATGAGSEAKD